MIVEKNPFKFYIGDFVTCCWWFYQVLLVILSGAAGDFNGC